VKSFIERFVILGKSVVKETYGVYFQNHYCLQWMVAVLASDSGAL
jgi:hypothetical protein